MSGYVKKGNSRCGNCGRRNVGPLGHFAPDCPERGEPWEPLRHEDVVRPPESPGAADAQAKVDGMQTQRPAEYLNRSALVARGWTIRMVARLGAPDNFAANPHHPAGASMALYSRARVEAVEALPAFRAEIEAVERRRAQRKEGGGRVQA